MNLVFGAISALPAVAPEAGDRMRSAVAATFGKPPQILLESGGLPSQLLGTVDDGGAIVGRARSDTAALVLIGCITSPVEGWSGEGSPIDDADATARFLLERYAARGRDFLTGINGQYAVAVADSRRGSMLLASDPWGGRSWFVREDDAGLSFCSHLLSLARGGAAGPQLDRSLEDFLLLYGFYPFGRTPFAGIRSLPPGSLLEWRDGRLEEGRVVACDAWPEAVTAGAAVRDEAGAIDILYEMLLRATREQLPSRRQRVAVLLGGFDSALVAAVIRRLDYEVETYSFHYEEAGYNQPHTETVARALGTRHHWVAIDRKMMEDGLRDFPLIFNQPTNWPNYVIQTARVCERIRADGIRHCYSGDGCDAVFMGYPGTYLRARVFDALPVIRGPLHDLLVGLAARPWLERRLGHPYRVLLSLLRGLGRRQPARGYLSFRIMDEVSLRQLRKDPAPVAGRSVDDLVEELSAPYAALPTLRLAYLGKAAVSPNRNKLLGSSDLSGVTILAPYMHPGLKKFALGLPESLLRPTDKSQRTATGKYILMKMAEQKRLLPAEVIHQPKMAAVDGPVDRWYAGPMRPALMDQMHGLPFAFDESYVARLLDLKLSETLFKRLVMTDKVISHAASLLATYAAFTGAGRG